MPINNIEKLEEKIAFYLCFIPICSITNILDMITVKIEDYGNLTSGQQAFAIIASRKLEEMVNNHDFLEGLKTITYSSNIYFPNDRYQIEATNEDLIRVITGGIEWMADHTGHMPDHQIDLRVKLCKDFAPDIIGGIDHPNPTIKTNLKFYNAWQMNNASVLLAEHWFHEWLHVAGFQHLKREGGAQPDYNDAVYSVSLLLMEVEDKYASKTSKDIRREIEEYFRNYGIPKNLQFAYS